MKRKKLKELDFIRFIKISEEFLENLIEEENLYLYLN
jgi:hypothetical protein